MRLAAEEDACFPGELIVKTIEELGVRADVSTASALTLRPSRNSDSGTVNLGEYWRISGLLYPRLSSRCTSVTHASDSRKLVLMNILALWQHYSGHRMARSRSHFQFSSGATEGGVYTTNVPNQLQKSPHRYCGREDRADTEMQRITLNNKCALFNSRSSFADRIKACYDRSTLSSFCLEFS